MGAKTLADRTKDAESFLKAYTAWCNGECYGYSIEDSDDPLDSCFGFLATDLDYMFECIANCVGDRPVMFTGKAKAIAEFHWPPKERKS